MLRTPKVPVWLICLNRRYGVVFSTNINLLNNWIYENYFQLHTYSGLKKQETPCVLSIDTRQQYPASIYGEFYEDADEHSPDMIHLLQTRFIKFDSVLLNISFLFYFSWSGCTVENIDDVAHDLMTIF